MQHHSSGDISDYAAELIKFKARHLVRNPKYRTIDREDVEQDLFLDLLHRLPHFDPSKSSLNTFIAKVIENRLVSILRYLDAEKRTRRREETSLNDPALDCDGRTVQRHETIVEASCDPQRIDDLRRDIADMLAQLSEVKRAIAIGIVGGTINSLANELEIPRSEVQRHLDELRDIFHDARLDQYL